MNEDNFSAIIAFIDEYYNINGKVPTQQEIADAIHLDKSNVSRNLKVMRERGLIDLDGGWGGIKTAKIQKRKTELNYVPVVGTIACGTPMLAEQNIDRYIPISRELIGNGDFPSNKER